MERVQDASTSKGWNFRGDALRKVGIISRGLIFDMIA